MCVSLAFGKLTEVNFRNMHAEVVPVLFLKSTQIYSRLPGFHTQLMKGIRIVTIVYSVQGGPVRSDLLADTTVDPVTAVKNEEDAASVETKHISKSGEVISHGGETDLTMLLFIGFGAILLLVAFLLFYFRRPNNDDDDVFIDLHDPRLVHSSREHQRTFSNEATPRSTHSSPGRVSLERGQVEKLPTENENTSSASSSVAGGGSTPKKGGASSPGGKGANQRGLAAGAPAGAAGGGKGSSTAGEKGSTLVGQKAPGSLVANGKEGKVNMGSVALGSMTIPGNVQMKGKMQPQQPHIQAVPVPQAAPAGSISKGNMVKGGAPQQANTAGKAGPGGAAAGPTANQHQQAAPGGHLAGSKAMKGGPLPGAGGPAAAAHNPNASMNSAQMMMKQPPPAASGSVVAPHKGGPAGMPPKPTGAAGPTPKPGQVAPQHQHQPVGAKKPAGVAPAPGAGGAPAKPGGSSPPAAKGPPGKHPPGGAPQPAKAGGQQISPAQAGKVGSVQAKGGGQQAAQHLPPGGAGKMPDGAKGMMKPGGAGDMLKGGGGKLVDMKGGGKPVEMKGGGKPIEMKGMMNKPAGDHTKGMVRQVSAAGPPGDAKGKK